MNISFIAILSKLSIVFDELTLLTEKLSASSSFISRPSIRRLVRDIRLMAQSAHRAGAYHCPIAGKGTLCPLIFAHASWRCSAVVFWADNQTSDRANQIQSMRFSQHINQNPFSGESTGEALAEVLFVRRPAT